MQQKTWGKQTLGGEGCGTQFCLDCSSITTITTTGGDGDFSCVGAGISATSSDRLSDDSWGVDSLPILGIALAIQAQTSGDHGTVLETDLRLLSITPESACRAHGVQAGLTADRATTSTDALHENADAVVAVGVNPPTINFD